MELALPLFQNQARSSGGRRIAPVIKNVKFDGAT